MSFFYLVKQDNRVRFSTYSFCQLTASSYPTYPGGARLNGNTVLFPDTRSFDTSHHRFVIEQEFCQCLASSVLPTPVVPRKKTSQSDVSDPVIRHDYGRTASATASIAHPDRLHVEKFLFQCNSYPFHFASILLTGIPVQRETTSAMSSASTSSLIMALSPCISRSCFEYLLSLVQSLSLP